MAKELGCGDFTRWAIGLVIYAYIIVLIVSSLLKVGPALALGIVVGVGVAGFALFVASGLVLGAIERRKPCIHGVRRGKDGGCTSCAAEEQSRKADEERRQAERREKDAIRERKKQISKQAGAMHDLELCTLRQRWLSNSDRYFELNSQQFENAIAGLFRKIGYEVEQTPFANDRGKDAIAWKDGKKYLIECKRYDVNNAVGRRDLQIFVAAMKEENAQGGFYINTGTFRRTVPEYAAQNQIELYDRARLPELVNLAYPVEEDVSTASVMCLECGTVANLPVGEAPTSGTCINGHQVTNEITTQQIRADPFRLAALEAKLAELQARIREKPTQLPARNGNATLHEPAETLESLWDYCAANSRAFPAPQRWTKLFEMLAEKQRLPSGGWKPALPLILGAWHGTTPIQKQLRFKEHVQWASDPGQIVEIGRYLRSLGEKDWYHLESFHEPRLGRKSVRRKGLASTVNRL